MHFKKLLLTVTALLLGLSAFCACGAIESTPVETTDGDPADGGSSASGKSTASAPAETSSPLTEVVRPTEAETRAADMVAAIFRQYAKEGGSGSYAYINLREYYGSDQSGYLWSNFCGVGMQYYVCKLYPDDAAQKDIFRKMINNFKYFRQRGGTAEAVKYHSARGDVIGAGYGDCFFDDNIWVARNYLRAYEILGDEWYLEEAIRVNNWVLSGWNEELGGLVWSEEGLKDDADAQHLERGLSANACGIIVNAMLADLVDSPEQKQFHLDWANKFYTFCKKMQNLPLSYDYWNGIHTVIVNGVRKNGEINKVHYSYNSGSMILADLLMYEHAADEAEKAAYLDDAIKTAAAARRTFYRFDAATKRYYYQGDPWFAAILNEAYYELAKYDASGKALLATFDQNVALAYANRDALSGLCPYQAPWQVTWDKNEAYVIHQVGFAQQAVLAALFSIGE